MTIISVTTARLQNVPSSVQNHQVQSRALIPSLNVNNPDDIMGVPPSCNCVSKLLFRNNPKLGIYFAESLAHFVEEGSSQLVIKVDPYT